MKAFPRSVYFYSVLFFLFLFSAQAAGAINTGSIGILPAYPNPNDRASISRFVYKLDLGENKKDAVRVINNREETAIIKLYPVDATVTSEGSFALLTEDAERKDVGSWVKLALNEVEVPPKSEKIVPFTITIPQEADVGDHAGGIIMEEVTGKDNKLSGTGVKIVTRVGIRIYETIPGAVRKDYTLTRFDWQTTGDSKANWLRKFIGLDKKTFFFVGLKNQGNVKISPKIKVEVRNIFNRLSGETPESKIGLVFPKTETKDSMAVWSGMPILGRYTAKLTVNFEEDGLSPTEKEIAIWAFPYRLAVELATLFILIVLIRLIRQYIREVRKEKMPIYTARSNDKIIQLANNFHIHWKKLARINDLKKPYEFKDGDKLFVPMKEENMDYFRKLHSEGRIAPPIEEQQNASRKSRRKFFKALILLGVILIGFSIYYFKFRKVADNSVPAASELESNPDQNKQPLAETIKKSSIEVKLCTLPGADLVSTSRLQGKLKLIGYGSADILGACGKSYANTTIEYGPGNKDQADIVKGSLVENVAIDEVEVPDAGQGITIYNNLNKDNFIEIKQVFQSVSAARELIKVAVANGGAADGKAEEIKNLLTDAGYSVADDIAQDKNPASGLAVVYGSDDQKDNAESVKNFLVEGGYASAVVKKITGSNDSLTLVVGK